MTRLIKMMLCLALIAVLLVSFSLATAQTPAPTPGPIAEANLAVISASNVGQLKSLGGLGVSAFYGFSPDSKTLFYTDNDGKLNIWDLAAGKISATIPTTRSQKYLSTDTKTLIVLNGSMIETWDTASAQKTKTVPIDPPPAQLYSLHFSPGGKFMGYPDTEAKSFVLWDTVTGKTLFTIPMGDSGGIFSAFTPDDKAVLVFGSRGDMQFIDTTSGKTLWKFHSDNVNGGQILRSPDEHVLAIVGTFGATDLVDMTSGKAVAKLPGDKTAQHYSLGAAFSPDGKWLWVISDSGAATAYDLTGKAGATIQTDTQVIPYGDPPEFNADGSLVALQIDRNLLEIADVASAKIVGKVTLAGDPKDTAVQGTWFSPDGKLLALLVNGNTIALWGIAG